MTGPEFPVPPSQTLPPFADDEAVRAAVALLDQDRRLGSWEHPLFLAIEAGCARISYLGLTDASGKWLENVAGVPFADEVRAALQRSLLGPDPGPPLPPDPVDQVVAAARLIAARVPNANLRLAVTPLGLGPGSGSGLAHSSDPETGAPGAVGSFLAGGIGSQLLDSGGVPIDDLEPEPWLTELRSLLDAAEKRTRRPIRAEFIIENGRLWVMSARPSVLHGAALVRATARSGGNREARPDQAVLSVSEDELARALAPHAAVSGLPLAARGLGVSPGIRSGTAVFSAADAVRARAEGRSPVLLLGESRPEDLGGLLAAAAIVTQRGGYTSHAAIVTRGLGVPCVTALRGAVVAQGTSLLLADGAAIVAGDEITVDGTVGLIYRGLATPPGAAAVSRDGSGAPHDEAGTRPGVDGVREGVGVAGVVAGG
ncbi:MAG TPA: PEP-utilizing enzyme, partial [Streptosporangiaceae bacterium]|nr:PEP-utilizing enzyme [Streptosporangiaceae bacterium]